MGSFFIRDAVPVTFELYRVVWIQLVSLCCAKSLQLCPTLCNSMGCSPQTLLSMEFSRQEYWSGLPFPIPLSILNASFQAWTTLEQPNMSLVDFGITWQLQVCNQKWCSAASCLWWPPTIFFKIYLFIWLCWVLIAAWELLVLTCGI